MTLTPNAEGFEVDLSLPDFYALGLSQLGFEHSTFRLLGECSDQLRHHCGLYVFNTGTCIIYNNIQRNQKPILQYYLNE